MLIFINMDSFVVKEHQVSIQFKNLLLKTFTTPVQKRALYRLKDDVISHLLN